jgi:hypothetical protein
MEMGLEGSTNQKAASSSLAGRTMSSCKSSIYRHLGFDCFSFDLRVTTLGDHLFPACHFSEGPFNGIRLRVTIPLSDRDRTVTGNPCQGEGITA